MISRTTRQKQILATIITSIKGFFDVPELLTKAQQEDHKISRATTYRFLKEKEQKGEVHRFVCSGKTLYSIKETIHAHFTCEQCKQVTHISCKKIDAFTQGVPGSICHIQIDISGICASCKKKNGPGEI